MTTQDVQIKRIESLADIEDRLTEVRLARKTTLTRVIEMPEPFEVVTREGVMQGKAGDMLAFGAADEPYPIARDIFEQTYAFADDEADPPGAYRALCDAYVALLREASEAAQIAAEEGPENRLALDDAQKLTDTAKAISNLIAQFDDLPF